MNSNRKGKVAEREAAKAVAEAFGVEARRGQQYSGLEAQDIVTTLPGVWFEVKRVEQLRLREAVAQAARDAGERVPVVLHRWNHGEWLCVVPLARLRELATAILEKPNG